MKDRDNMKRIAKMAADMMTHPVPMIIHLYVSRLLTTDAQGEDTVAAVVFGF